MSDQHNISPPLGGEKAEESKSSLGRDENNDVTPTHEKPDSADNSFSVSAASFNANGLENTFEKLSIPVTRNEDGSKKSERESESTDLYSKINSKDLEIFHCISLLEHNDNIGIQYYICKRIQKFPMGELRFLLHNSYSC